MSYNEDDDQEEFNASEVHQMISEIQNGSKEYVTAFIAGGVFWVRDAIDLSDAYEKVKDCIAVSVKPTTIDDLEMIKSRDCKRFEGKFLEFPPVAAVSNKYHNYIADYGGTDRVPINLSISDDDVMGFLCDKTDDVLADLLYDGDDEGICQYYRKRNIDHDDGQMQIYVIHVSEGIIPLKGVADTNDALHQAREIAWCRGRKINDYDYETIDSYGSRSTERLFFGDNYIKKERKVTKNDV